MSKLKSGDYVTISKSTLKFFREKAYEMCNVQGTMGEEDAEDYMAMKMLGLGFPYKARLGNATEDKMFHVHIDLGNKVKDFTVLEAKDLRKVRHK